MYKKQNLICLQTDHKHSTLTLKLYLLLQFVVFPLMLFNTIGAQETELRFEHLGIDEGLSQNTVNSIYQDSKGFIWIATNQGLNKFDGYEFTVFEKGMGSYNYSADDLILSVFEDSKKNLWIGTENDGLAIYNSSDNKFIHITHNPNRLKGDEIRAISEDRNGNIWIASLYSIDMVDQKQFKTIEFIPPHLNKAKSLSSELNTIYFDNDNNLWFGTSDNGLGLFDIKTNTYQYFKFNTLENNCLNDNDIRSIYEDSKGNMWIGTYNGGLNLFNREEKTFKPVFPDPLIPESLTIKAILEDSKGNLWLGTRNGLYLYNIKMGTFRHYSHDPHNPNSLCQNNVQVIFKDIKGDFWFGTKGGISFLNSTNIPFVHYRADKYNKKYLNHNEVSSILEDNRGDLWFGTVEGGLNHLDRKKGVFSFYKHDPGDPKSVSSNNINSIIQDYDGEIWIGTFQGGLNHFDQKSKTFEYYKIDPDESLINQRSIKEMSIDENNDIWVAAMEDGLKKFIKKKQKFISIPLRTLDKQAIIHSISIDSKGEIWAGSDARQLFKIDPQTYEYTEYKIPVSDHTIINSIQEGPEGNLWLTTRGEGLFYFDQKENQFHNLSMEDGLSNNNVLGMVYEKNNLWFTTGKGLSKYDIKTKKFKNYLKENGLASNQFMSSPIITRSGEIFCGSINGVVAFYPEKIIADNDIQPVIITDFKIFNKAVAIGGENPVLDKPIIDAENIQLSYEQSVFTFTFAALNYEASKLTQYAYIMEGFEKEWNYVGKRRFATYTNLNPGTYAFRVKATTGNGIWNPKDTSINITIAPPFWQTWWFMLIIASTIALIIGHLINYLNQKRNLLKTKSLANLTQLKLLRNQMNPHFLLNSFNALRALILIDKKQAWQMITEFSEYFRYVLIKYNKIQDTLKEEIDAAKNYINIQKLLTDNLTVSFKVDREARGCIVPAFIFQPLIENAVKFGKKTNPDSLKIYVSLKYDNNILAIDVSNSGKLFRPEGNGKAKDSASGTSISNIKKRLEILFNDQYSFELFENAGYVHAKILINYSKIQLAEPVNPVANELAEQLPT